VYIGLYIYIYIYIITSQSAKFHLASYLQDVFYSAESKIPSCKLLARCILLYRRQDVSYYAGCKILSCKSLCKMYLILQSTRYYLASHLQDVSYSARCKICDLQDARYYLASHLPVRYILQVTYLASCRVRYSISARYYLASHFQDVSCSIQKARFYLASHLQDISYSKMLLDNLFKMLSRKLNTCLNLEIYLQDIIDGTSCVIIVIYKFNLMQILKIIFAVSHLNLISMYFNEKTSIKTNYTYIVLPPVL